MVNTSKFWRPEGCWLNNQVATRYEEGIHKLVPMYDKCLNVKGDYMEKWTKAFAITWKFTFCIIIIEKYLGMAKRSLLYGVPRLFIAINTLWWICRLLYVSECMLRWFTQCIRHCLHFNQNTVSKRAVCWPYWHERGSGVKIVLFMSGSHLWMWAYKQCMPNRARWLRDNARDSHSGGRGFKSRCRPTWLGVFPWVFSIIKANTVLDFHYHDPFDHYSSNSYIIKLKSVNLTNETLTTQQ